MSSNAASGLFRIEHDLLGEREIPADAYWGIHSLRARENFPISGSTIGGQADLVRALACVKLAAARANQDLGVLPAERAGAIVQACQEIIEGALHDQFIVDVIQGGAGTSTNMNANEVIANRALELLGARKGQYDVLHPIQDVNASQSTNDVYPTALRIAMCFSLQRLLVAMAELRGAFEAKALEFDDVLKMGRTQLQDAVPMTLGQEFLTYAVMLGEDEARLGEARTLMVEVNLGATAIGTGINTDPDYSPLAVRYLAEITGLPLVRAANMIEATQDTGAFVQLSGVLKRVACKLSKTCNDLRLLSSGPQSGLNEINLPERAAGSSIMPGKVNPIIPEVVNQVAFEVIGNDMTITMASESGQLQLNAFEPIIAWSLVKSISHLEAACTTLTHNCVKGITANRERLAQAVKRSAGLATALNPVLGYEAATRIARDAMRTGRPVADLVLEAGLLDAETLEQVLKPEVLTRPYRFKKVAV
ncbi:aspartate ammonia-lyase [Pigmentiphaga sp. GD03639]|jgi:aspartate ammonia-lyase|uniref:Aspartate ammonia-lyase n=1 Tax=Pigmentiphaga daeguensis TaxID=414049 RepID=A0ABN1C479_9BURK|nr:MULTISPECIES: aspartate ammonia-lyase [unclassified Pigmentiphaga]MDH2238403.1 aspartate ammonia-lyase [Pigmentiphaga sp. GD03639]OVZ65448.1 aspartate ammonia-lyase [Pigmentiphaga sp. NML030171]